MSKCTPMAWIALDLSLGCINACLAFTAPHPLLAIVSGAVAVVCFVMAGVWAGELRR